MKLFNTKEQIATVDVVLLTKDNQQYSLSPNTTDTIEFEHIVKVMIDDVGNKENKSWENLGLFLTADTTFEKLQDLIINGDNTPLIFYIKQFTDGRVFSLIRHCRQKGYQGQIIIIGQFAADQAGYFVKSGASGFVVADGQADTLTLTLKDLQTAHVGLSANQLPMFR
ncbi:DUF934 domain-containing protein [Moraxella nasovis]|uniref:DUF934 domain-containing protein n=1 Tax=Moraxella nasovis TaxID=2904121 RepID=UPI001F61EBDB|nr:DUF934 domain-containing protein [Moraxella nasovis]UNU74209.1 DUF934 domain-containing protein [Moraxella nasovis]